MASAKHSVIVVGGGVVGLATAYHLARQGVKKIVVLEQFPMPHTRGSSHGHSRVIRYAFEDAFYSKLIVDAFRMWHQLERETGMKMIIKSEFLALGPPGSRIIKDITDFMKKVSVPYECLNSSELTDRYPMCPRRDHQCAILDRSGGIMPADKVLRVLAKLVVEYGGEIREREEVIAIEPRNVYTTIVTTSQAVYSSKSVVIANGAWAAKIAKPLGINLPITPTRATVMFWEEKNKGTYTRNVLPPFIDYHAKYHVCGTPTFEYPGHIKIHTNIGYDVNPDLPDACEDESVQFVRDYVRAHLHGIKASAPSIVEYCLLSNSPDSHFIVDVHPKWKNIIFGVGMSGHGFSLSIVVGKILADLAVGTKTAYDISQFSMKRFHSSQFTTSGQTSAESSGSRKPRGTSSLAISSSGVKSINKLFTLSNP